MPSSGVHCIRIYMSMEMLIAYLELLVVLMLENICIFLFVLSLKTYVILFGFIKGDIYIVQIRHQIPSQSIDIEV